MDFVVELVVQLIGELLIETAAEGSARVLRSRRGRWVTESLAGLGFGVLWGIHLHGGHSWPKLLWVSLGLAAVSAALAAGRPSPDEHRPPAARHLFEETLTPPWRWGRPRLIGLALLNVMIAAGVVLGFAPGRLW